MRFSKSLSGHLTYLYQLSKPKGGGEARALLGKECPHSSPLKFSHGCSSRQTMTGALTSLHSPDTFFVKSVFSIVLTTLGPDESNAEQSPAKQAGAKLNKPSQAEHAKRRQAEQFLEVLLFCPEYTLIFLMKCAMHAQAYVFLSLADMHKPMYS